jgi:secondary thiamine-phosphate synthase enzyme
MVFGEEICLRTRGFSDVHNITEQVQELVAGSGITSGQALVFVIGSTGSLTTLEFEPALVEDLRERLEHWVPRDLVSRHSRTWGDDNGFSHLRAALLGPSLTVPVVNGSLRLGRWQQIILIDHDNRPRERRLFVQVMGE